MTVDWAEARPSKHPQKAPALKNNFQFFSGSLSHLAVGNAPPPPKADPPQAPHVNQFGPQQKWDDS